MRRAALLALIVVAAWPASSARAASSAGCARSTFPPDRSPGLADTTWPTEHADGWRTHAVATGLPSGVAKLRLHAATATMPPVPVWGYVGTGRDVYVIGGSPYLLDVFTELIQGAPAKSTPLLAIRSKRYSETVTPYVARIDTKTMKVTQLPLTQGTSANYTGGLLLHSNGFLYAVDRATLYKIDLSTFTVVASVALPLAPDASGQPNEQTAYNGIQVSGEGDLILKGWASTGGGDLPPGILLRIDPNDLSTKAQLITTDVAAARMALAVVDGAEYLYFPDQEQSVRFLLGTNSFTLDGGFTKTYLTAKGTTEASSDVYMGRGVVFATNTDPTATTPMQLFAQGNGGTPFRATPGVQQQPGGLELLHGGRRPVQVRHRRGARPAQRAHRRLPGMRRRPKREEAVGERRDRVLGRHGDQLQGGPALRRRPALLERHEVHLLPRRAQPSDGQEARRRQGQGDQADDRPDLHRPRRRVLHGDPDARPTWLRHPRDRPLAVGPEEVVLLVEASDGRLAGDGAVVLVVVVAEEPSCEGVGAFAA